MKNNTFAAAVDQYAQRDFDLSKMPGFDPARMNDPAAPAAAAPAAVAPAAVAPAAPKFKMREKPKPEYRKPNTVKKPPPNTEVPATFKDKVEKTIKLAGTPKKMPDRKPTTGPIPPLEKGAYQESKNLSGIEHGEELQRKGDQTPAHEHPMDLHLESAGVFDASPGQLSQFAKMLGIDVWAAVQSPEQLRAAIEYGDKQESLLQILRKSGLMAGDEEKGSRSEKAGSMVGDFVSGFVDKSPIGKGGRLASRLARQVTGNRFSAAAALYAAEYEPMQVNAIPPPKAPGPGPMFTAKTNHPDADFWIARRGSSKTVGKPHREYSPHSIGITVNREHLDPDYAFHLMDHLHQKGHWAERATGTTNLVNIDNSHIKELQGMMQPAPTEPGPPVEGPIPPLPAEDDDDLDYWMDSPEESAPPMESQEPTYGEKEVAKIQSGITMPTGEIENEDAKGGDQLGLFGGTGKKKVVGTKYKQDKPQGDAKQDVMFERMDDDPDQQTLFSTFGEATARYQAGLKKK